MSRSSAEVQLTARPEAGPLEPQDPAVAFTGAQGLEMVVEMAHDLRSPLTSILFLSETIESGASGPVTETQRQQLALIRSAALCLCASANDVMELARRGGDGPRQRAAAPLSLTDVVGTVRDLVHPLAEQKGLELRVSLCEPLRRIGHEHALSRVLLNLTTNALKYTERGHVEIMARDKGPTRVEFAVRDTGPGITPDEMRMLYQPFHRVGNARVQFSSAGLGLSIVRKLVAGMGAELRVMTRVGSGTRFWFEIELPPAPAEA